MVLTLRRRGAYVSRCNLCGWMSMAELNIHVSRYGWHQLYWIETVEVVHREMWYAVWEEGQRASLRSRNGLPDRPFPAGLVTSPRWPWSAP